LKWISFNKFEKALDDQGIQYSQISTRPAAFNTILWNANVDTNDAYFIADYSFFDSQPITFEKFSKNRSAEPVYESVAARKNLERLKDIAQGWYLMEQKNGSWYFYDLRFGQIPVSSTEQVFVFAYRLELQDHKLTATETEKNIDDASLIFNQLWERIQGN
jgi:inner membrane protein